jgi:hypothetical protein
MVAHSNEKDFGSGVSSENPIGGGVCSKRERACSSMRAISEALRSISVDFRVLPYRRCRLFRRPSRFLFERFLLREDEPP